MVAGNDLRIGVMCGFFFFAGCKTIRPGPQLEFCSLCLGGFLRSLPGSSGYLGVVKMSVVLLLGFYKPHVCIFIMIAAVRTF